MYKSSFLSALPARSRQQAHINTTIAPNRPGAIISWSYNRILHDDEVLDLYRSTSVARIVEEATILLTCARIKETRSAYRTLVEKFLGHVSFDRREEDRKITSDGT
jgi:hypothetical protein